MIRLSQTARSVGESATLKLNATAQSLRAAGEPVIHLGGGEPVSRAPAAALAAATALLETGAVRYTPPDGTPALKQAIARYTEEFYGWTPRADQILERRDRPGHRGRTEVKLARRFGQAGGVGDADENAHGMKAIHLVSGPNSPGFR